MAVRTWLDRKLSFYRSSALHKSYEVLNTIANDIERANRLYPESLQLLELRYIMAFAQLNCGLIPDSVDSFEKVLNSGLSIPNSTFILGLSEFLLAEISLKRNKDFLKAKIRYKNAIIHFKECSSLEYIALSNIRICDINIHYEKINDCITPLKTVLDLLDDFKANPIIDDGIENDTFLNSSGVEFKSERFKEIPSNYLRVQSLVNYYQGNIKLSISNIENALRLDDLKDLKYSKIQNLSLKAKIHLEEEDFDKALNIYQNCIELISGNIKVYFKELCSIYHSIAIIYLKDACNDEKKAFKYLMLSLNLAKQYQLIIEASKVLETYTILNKRNDIDKLSISINAENLMHWLELRSETSSKSVKVQVYRSIGTYFYQSSDYEEAIKYLSQANTINKSLNSESFDLAIDKIDFINEVGGKALKLKQLELDKAEVKIEEQEELVKHNKNLEEELKTKDQDLQNVSEELKDYLKIATHDFKEPIRNIVNMTQLLKTKLNGSLSKDHSELIDYVLSCSLQLNGLSNDLIEYVNVSHNSPKSGALYLSKIITQIKTSELKFSDGRHLSLSLDLEVEKISGDYNSIYNLFKNLIKNAVNFRKDGIVPQIKIIGRELEDHWKFAVMDNGIGIEDKNFGNIFKPFTKLKETAGPHNNGIGLSICKKAVELHGGRIWLNSIPGKGSTFHFTIYKEVQFQEPSQFVEG